MYPGREYSGHFQSERVFEKSSCLREGELKPMQAFPSAITPTAFPAYKTTPRVLSTLVPLS